MELERLGHIELDFACREWIARIKENPMSDRCVVLTVVLDQPTKLEAIESTVDAIKHLRGVIEVTAEVVDHGYYAARSQLRQEIRRKLLDALED